MQIRDFGVERWMYEYEHEALLNLAETCVAPLTVAELLTIAGKDDTFLHEMLPMRLNYGVIDGSERLRSNIATLYEKQQASNILITHGAISANALLYETLVEPGDRVISILPTYQQHYSIPESLGAKVETLQLREENGFLPDLDKLRAMATSGVRLIVFSNPNNPTGALMNRQMLATIAEIARSCGAYILCDEVYRGADQRGDGFTSSIADIYEKGVSTGSMSKTWSLAGLRIGWIAAPRALLRRVDIHRDYNTISVGMLNDLLASIALESRDALLKRNHNILRTNLAVLDGWLETQPRLSCIRPQSGTTAWVRLDVGSTSRDFCVALLKETGVMLVPGSAMDCEGYVRIGYANALTVLEAGLEKISAFLRGENF
jgi:aspartate/methionine/tyrosine aminotransferase